MKEQTYCRVFKGDYCEYVKILMGCLSGLWECEKLGIGCLGEGQNVRKGRKKRRRGAIMESSLM